MVHSKRPAIGSAAHWGWLVQGWYTRSSAAAHKEQSEPSAAERSQLSRGSGAPVHSLLKSLGAVLPFRLKLEVPTGAGGPNMAGPHAPSAPTTPCAAANCQPKLNDEAGLLRPNLFA